MVALIIGTATPLKSTAFHTLSTISGLLLYFSIVIATSKNADFSDAVAVELLPGSLIRWAFIATILASLFVAARAFPNALAVLRAAASDLIWSPVYFMLVSQPRFSKPRNLSKIYNREGTPKKLSYQPYFMQHPQNLPQSLSIPSPESMEANVSIFKKVVKTVKGAFA